jgi:hypothetical protein
LICFFSLLGSALLWVIIVVRIFFVALGLVFFIAQYLVLSIVAVIGLIVLKAVKSGIVRPRRQFRRTTDLTVAYLTSGSGVRRVACIFFGAELLHVRHAPATFGIVAHLLVDKVE